MVEKREKQLTWAKKRRSNLNYPSWVDELLKPIAEEMVKQMPDRYYEILGPFGMDANTSIFFYRKETPGSLVGDNCLSITFSPGNLDIGELRLKDYLTNTHRYSQGTMGEMNGMNYPTVECKKTIDELMLWLKEQNAKKGCD